MEGTPSELRVTMAADPAWAPMVGEVAAQAARQRGHADTKASAFGSRVEGAVRDACAAAARAGAEVACVVRLTGAQVEVDVAGQRGSRTVRLE